MRYSNDHDSRWSHARFWNGTRGNQRQQDEGKRTQVAELERRAEALNHQIGAGKLGATERDELAKQQREIRRMIHQLEAGGAVEPSEIERVR